LKPDGATLLARATLKLDRATLVPDGAISMPNKANLESDGETLDPNFGDVQSNFETQWNNFGAWLHFLVSERTTLVPTGAN
jgi:hypothetical protein